MTETSGNHDINFLLPSKKTTGHVVEFLLLDIQEDKSDTVVFRPYTMVYFECSVLALFVCFFNRGDI